MRIDGFFPGQSAVTSNAADILSRVNVGDVIRAQILDITSSELILKLFDGSTVNATSTVPVDAKRGEFVDFAVKNKNDKQLLLEALKNNDKKTVDADSELKKQLLSSGIKPDSENIEIAREIKAGNMPVNKEVFQKITDLMSKFKDVSPAKAAYILSNNMEANEKNISSLNQLVEGKLRVGMDIENLAKSLSEIQDDGLLDNIQKQLSNIANADVEEGAQGLNPGVAENGLAGAGKDIKSAIQALGLKDKLEEYLRLNKGNVEEFLKQELEILERSKPDDPDVKNLKQLLKDSDASNHQNKLRNSLQKSLDDLFVKITSQTQKEDVEVNKLYKDALQKLEAIKESLEHSNISNRQELLDKIDNVENNLKFLNDLNKFQTYIQIPLRLQDKNTTGELYILKKDSRKKKIDPENATMFVSLSTNNLGQFDSLISVNKKNISLNIRVEEQKVIDFMKQNYKELYNRLSDKGFKLVDVKYRLLEEPVNILNVDEVVRKELAGNRTSIDYRL